MTTAVAKLGAIVVACGIIATAAIPAYADLGPQGVVQARPVAAQTVSVATSVDVVASSRDAYTVTKPAPVAAPPTIFVKTASLVNKFVGATPPGQAYSGAAILAYGAQFVGVVPYGTGNSPTTSFSCDGFTQYVFAGLGISLPRGADHQAALGVVIDQSQAVAGDLVWWPHRHVGIYDGAGGMYNSPTWGRYVEHVTGFWGSPLFVRLKI